MFWPFKKKDEMIRLSSDLYGGSEQRDLTGIKRSGSKTLMALYYSR